MARTLVQAMDSKTMAEVKSDLIAIDSAEGYGPHLLFKGLIHQQRLLLERQEIQAIVEWAFTQGIGRSNS